MSGPAKFPSREEAHAAHWFSRRHRTDEAHRAEQVRREAKRSARRARELASQQATR